MPSRQTEEAVHKFIYLRRILSPLEAFYIIKRDHPMIPYNVSALEAIRTDLRKYDVTKLPKVVV
jgi:hypothetical protein